MCSVHARTVKFVPKKHTLLYNIYSDRAQQSCTIKCIIASRRVRGQMNIYATHFIPLCVHLSHTYTDDVIRPHVTCTQQWKLH